MYTQEQNTELIEKIRKRIQARRTPSEYTYFPSYREINDEATKEETLQWLLYVVNNEPA